MIFFETDYKTSIESASNMLEHSMSSNSLEKVNFVTMLMINKKVSLDSLIRYFIVSGNACGFQLLFDNENYLRSMEERIKSACPAHLKDLAHQEVDASYKQIMCLTKKKKVQELNKKRSFSEQDYSSTFLEDLDISGGSKSLKVSIFEFSTQELEEEIGDDDNERLREMLCGKSIDLSVSIGSEQEQKKGLLKLKEQKSVLVMDSIESSFGSHKDKLSNYFDTSNSLKSKSISKEDFEVKNGSNIVPVNKSVVKSKATSHQSQVDVKEMINLEIEKHKGAKMIEEDIFGDVINPPFNNRNEEKSFQLNGENIDEEDSDSRFKKPLNQKSELVRQLEEKKPVLNDKIKEECPVVNPESQVDKEEEEAIAQQEYKDLVNNSLSSVEGEKHQLIKSSFLKDKKSQDIWTDSDLIEGCSSSFQKGLDFNKLKEENCSSSLYIHTSSSSDHHQSPKCTENNSNYKHMTDDSLSAIINYSRQVKDGDVVSKRTYQTPISKKGCNPIWHSCSSKNDLKLPKGCQPFYKMNNESKSHYLKEFYKAELLSIERTKSIEILPAILKIADIKQNSDDNLKNSNLFLKVPNDDYLYINPKVILDKHLVETLQKENLKFGKILLKNKEYSRSTLLKYCSHLNDSIGSM